MPLSSWRSMTFAGIRFDYEPKACHALNRIRLGVKVSTEVPMKIRVLFALICLPAAPWCLRAESSGPVALTGQVTSAEEGRMEGVLVSAKKAGSTITITVVTDDQGP